jgi:hypothetical protein
VEEEGGGLGFEGSKGEKLLWRRMRRSEGPMRFIYLRGVGEGMNVEEVEAYYRQRPIIRARREAS